MIGHTLRHNKEFHNTTLEGMIEGKHSRAKPYGLYSIILSMHISHSYKLL